MFNELGSLIYAETMKVTVYKLLVVKHWHERPAVLLTVSVVSLIFLQISFLKYENLLHYQELHNRLLFQLRDQKSAVLFRRDALWY